MKILQRYVLREFLLPFAYCFLTFYGLYVLSTLFSTFRKIADAQPPAWFVVRYLIDYMSPYVVWLLPASLMLAALYTMWRFCHHSEIVAMRANGLSYATVVAPMLGVAVVAALLCALNLEFYAPHGREFARRVEDNNFHPAPAPFQAVNYHNYEARRTWRINRTNLDDPRVLEGVRISIDGPDRRKLVDIDCRRVEYLDGVWWLYSPQYKYFDADANAIATPTNALLSLGVRPMPHFTERPRDFSIAGRVAPKEGGSRENGWEYLSLRDMIWWVRTNPQTDHNSKLCDIHARIAMPWACVVITLFAIPAGVATGRQSVFKGVLLAIALFFGFYLAVNGCMLLAKNELLPPWLAAWLPNVGFFGAGLALFARLR
jgi:lipopolysaccharide export system permease protein